MAVPTTLTPKAVNNVTFKPADASQSSVAERKPTQSNSDAVPTKKSNDKSVSSSSTSAPSKSDLSSVLLPVKVSQPPTSAQLDVTIENQQYQLSKTAELQKLLQQTAQVVIASDQAKLVTRAVASVNQPQVQAELINNSVAPVTLVPGSTVSAPPLPTQTVSTQLILLAQAIQLALPQALEALAKQNGVSTQQLATLATRPQGYPLPTAVIDQGQLTFASGTSITLAPNSALSSGQYLAKVVLQNQQLQLALTPVIAELSVNLTKLTAPQITEPLQTANIIITKNEPGQILSQFLKKLESTPLPTNITAAKTDASQPNAAPTKTEGSQLNITPAKTEANQPNINPAKTDGSQPNVAPAKTDANQLNINASSSNLSLKTAQDSNTVKTTAALTQKPLSSQTNQQAQLSNTTEQSILKANPTTVSANHEATNKLTSDPAPIEVLNKALSKAGAMPIKQQLTQQVANNLASELFKHLPQISPHPLSALSDPALLSSELYSLAALNLANPQISHSGASQPSTLFSGSAITTLFQLLLGVKTKSTGAAISDKLQAHLAQLQQRTLSKLSANSGLLAALDKLGGADSLAQLASSIALYQHASTDPNQAMTWYFALPYSINQRDEQFEGKFEQENDQDKDKKAGWKLQLKFNLAQGSLLICANKQGDVLDIQFKGNNQMLLTKVERFNQALSDKITQIGFTPGKLTTQLAPIPATLLPGDHYLVKTRA
ncbi:flagellar hook-length control protein FliK [Shewanella vesiculosa]|uniref:Flagellar hook-length control protein FliK n=1 Tax=Shewanella vesiculosa TaxID=518738 RepID=A0ABV0FPQ2_9GAMM